MLICKNDKIVVPNIIRKYKVIWYHKYQLHLGEEHTEDTIIKHCYWPKLRDKICTRIKVCKTCQKNNKENLRYGKFPAKEAEAIPWDRLLAVLIGP